MFSSMAIEKALRSRQTTHFRLEVRNVLDMIDSAVRQDGLGRPLLYGEIIRIADSLCAVFDAWTGDFQSARFTASVPAGLDQAATVACLNEILGLRCRAAAAVLTRALDERLVLEVRIARGTYTLESQASRASQC